MKKSETKQKTEYKKESSKYLTKIRESFKATKFDKRFKTTFIYDLIFSIISIILLVGFVLIGVSYLENSGQINLITLENIQNIQENAQLLSTLSTLLLLVLGFFLIKFVISGFFKGTIWKNITGKKMNTSFYFNYLFIKVLLFLAVFFIFLIGGILGNSKTILIILGIISIFLWHISFITIINTAQSDKLWNSIGNAFKKGTKKIHLLIFPYLIILIIYYLALLINQLIAYLISAPTLDFANIPALILGLNSYMTSSILYKIISTLILLAFLAFLRIFYFESLKRI